MVKGRKEWGAYKTDICVFCGAPAYSKNSVKLPVCKNHKETGYPDLKCFCGSWIDVRMGKYGAYCQCLKCGNLNLAKVLEYNMAQPRPTDAKRSSKGSKDSSISSAEKKALDNYDIPLF
ncbi:MAG: hypothetical protein ACOCWQ_03170 [Nanoarchaeota archaeon]